MKPEWCSEEIWNAAKDAAGEIYSGPMIYNDGCSIIARALLDAHQRGRREGLEEAAEVARELLVYADTTSEADIAIPAAIRVKMEDQP